MIGSRKGNPFASDHSEVEWLIDAFAFALVLAFSVGCDESHYSKRMA